jgi:O-antigen/teichoic acid export membrane protein
MAEERTLAAGLRRKGAGILLSNGIAIPLQLLSGIVVIRLVGAQGRGTVVLLVSLVTILATLGQFGFLAASTYYLRKEIYTERTLIANYAVVIVVVSVVCGGLVLTGSSLINRLFFGGASISRGVLLLGISPLPLVMFTSFIATLLLAKGEARTYSALIVIPAATSLVLTVAFVAGLDLGVTGALLAALLAQVVAVIVGGVPMLHSTRGQKAKLGWETMNTLGRFGLKYYVVTLSVQIFKRGDHFLLAYFLNLEAVAYYSIGVSLYELVLGVPRGVSGLIAGEAAGQPERSAGRLVARAARSLVWLMAFGALVLGLLSYWLIPPIYGQDFVQARAPALILLAGAVLFGFALTLQNYFIGVGRPGIIAILSLAGGAVNFVLSILLIQSDGLVGNALATILGAGVSAALFLFSFSRRSHVPMRSTFLPPPTDLLVWPWRRPPRMQQPES